MNTDEPLQWRIRLFGPLQIVANETEIRNPAGKARNLLAYLLVYGDRGHTREQVMDALWPELPPDRARRALSDTLYRLRETPAGALVFSEGEEIALARDTNLWVDIWTFQGATRSEDAAALDDALALARAPILPEIYDDWILARRAALQDERASLLRRRARIAEEQNDLDLANALFQQIAEDDNLDEGAWRGRMRTLARMGQLRDALDVYARLEQLLDEEIGAPPEAETVDLIQQIRREFEAQRIRASDQPYFVGRTRERSLLVAALDSAIEGRGGMRVVLAENGMGRTTLLQEVERSARWRGMQVVWGRGDSGVYPTLFAPLAQALEQALPEARMQQLGTMVRGQWLSAVQQLLTGSRSRASRGEGLPDAPPQTIAPQRDVQEVALAVASILRSLGKIVPHLILLDDMQWADRSLWDLLDAMRQSFAQSRVLILVSSRLAEMHAEGSIHERLAAWDQEGSVAVQTLEGLAEQELGEFLAHHRVRPEEESRLAEIHRESHGNPMLALMLASLPRQTDIPTTGEGGIDLTDSFIQESLLRHYRTLPADLRGALEECAILGSRFSWQVWSAFRQAIARDASERASDKAGAPRKPHPPGRADATIYPRFLLDGDEADDLANELPLLAGQLEQQELLTLDGGNYRFSNSLLQQAVVRQIAPEESVRLHRIAFHAVAGVANAPMEQHLRHALLGELHEETFRYAMQMGEAAMATGSTYSARECFDLALKSASSFDAETLRREERYRLYLNRSRVLGMLGLREEQQADLRELSAVAESLGDEGRRIESANLMANYLYITGAIDEALEAAQKALARGAGARLTGEEARLHESLARIQRERKETAAALHHVEEARERYAALQNLAGVAEVTDLRAGLAYDVGDYRRAAAGHLEAANLFGELGDILREAKALNNLGTIYWELGDYAGARITHERALRVSRAAGDLLGEGDNIDNLGGVYWSLGNYDEAIAHYSAALHLRRSIRDEWGIGISLGNLGSALLRQGNPQEALAYYGEAWPLYRKNGRRRSEGYVLHNIGCARLELGDVQGALTALREGLAIREEIGDVSKVIESYAGLALAQLAAEEDAAANESADKAIALLEDGTYPDALRQEVYCAAWQIADLNGDHARAREHFGKAELAMDALCATLPPESVATFLVNVPLNRQVVGAIKDYAHTIEVECARIGAARGRALRPDELCHVRWGICTPGDEQIADATVRRRRVLIRLLKQAAEQGASPTDDQFAGALGVSRRTILRDIAALEAEGIQVETRSRSA